MFPMAVGRITSQALKIRLLVLLLAFVIACWLVLCPRLPRLSDGIRILSAAIFLVAPWIFDSSSFAPPHRCIVLRKEVCICAEHLPHLEVECTEWPDIMQQKLL